MAVQGGRSGVAPNRHSEILVKTHFSYFFFFFLSVAVMPEGSALPVTTVVGQALGGTCPLSEESLVPIS